MPNYGTMSGPTLPSKRLISAIVIAVVALIAVVVVWSNTLTTVHATEVCVKQNAVDGQLQVWTDSGLHNKNFGRVTCYTKSSEFSFSAAVDQGKATDQSIKARFNDGGHGYISGTLRWEMPTTPEQVMALHVKFGSEGAVEQQLIRTAVERSVYMTGPLMSSKESAAERRGDLISYIEDQVKHGIFRTESEEVKVRDPLSGQERTVTKVKLVIDPKSINGFARQEPSPLADFGVKTYNFNINGIRYDEQVEKQIAGQQDLAMQVQTAIASAKKAEQDAITAAKQGEAAAAKAKWEQEVLKATAVTEAQQKVEVATLAVKQAELYKREQTLIGEGDAARRKAMIVADGALEAKLKVYETVMTRYADQLGKQQWVPSIVMGGNGSPNGAASAATLIEMLNAKTARDLSLDLTVPKK